MQITRLETLDQAKALRDCVYAVYGLTFHRDWVYDPDRVLSLNQTERIRSFLAMDGRRVVGHLAAIRPFFEVERDGEPVSDPGVIEVGLSIVRPDARGSGLQAQLGAAMFSWGHRKGVVGAFMRCVTQHTYSQRTARGAGGRPVALMMGAIPRWVMYDDTPAPSRQPISTLLHFVPVHGDGDRAIHIPASTDWLRDLIREAGVERTISGNCVAEVGPTDVEIEFHPDRQLGMIHVLSAGPDVAAVVEEKTRWLMGGHMQHVTVYLPADSYHVARAIPRFAEMGLFPAGWVPCLYRGRRDALVYQAVTCESIQVESIEVDQDDAKQLRDHVTAGFVATREATRGLLRPIDRSSADRYAS